MKKKRIGKPTAKIEIGDTHNSYSKRVSDGITTISRPEQIQQSGRGLSLGCDRGY